MDEHTKQNTTYETWKAMWYSFYYGIKDYQARHWYNIGISAETVKTSIKKQHDKEIYTKQSQKRYY